jgi:histidine kinase/DNA gyrase B/HSP90-like ATPase
MTALMEVPMPSTHVMTVENIAFLLDRLATDTPPNQQIRELTQNAIEAIARRHKSGDAADGVILWDVDWDHLTRTGEYKLCIVDNGDGMSPEEMTIYLNRLAVQGANQTQSISRNFGVGAKISALYRNRYGLVYQSWREGKGAMVKLHRDDKKGEYGLASFDLPDGPHWSPKIKDGVKPRTIGTSGTKVTLLGESEPDNTCFPREDAGSGMNWLIRYLTTRYFRLPENLKLQVRVLVRDEERWPSAEPVPSEKTFNLQTVRGTKHLLDEYATAKGTVRLATADAHWWMFDDPSKASKDMSTRGGRTCQLGVVFQDEIYIQRVPPAARRVLAGFGIVFGAEHVVIYVEPREGGGLEIVADTARSRLLINGQDLEEANWWETWGAEFQKKLPAEIKGKIEQIMARTEGDPDGKKRERILERLKRIRDLLRPTRFRRDLTSPLMAHGSVIGGRSKTAEENTREVGDLSISRSRLPSGRASDDYLADLVESEGEPAARVEVKSNEPEVKWVSVADKTRPEDELEDVAAEIVGDPMTGELIKANADFRGYRDILAFFTREFNPAGDEAIERKIVEYVREWMESQLIEVVMTVRNLANGRTWNATEVEKALSAHALTAVLLARFHIVERVKRSLSSDLAKPSTRAA